MGLRKVQYIDYMGKMYMPPSQTKEDEKEVAKYRIDFSSSKALEPAYYFTLSWMAGPLMFKVIKIKDTFRYSGRSGEWTASESKKGAKLDKVIQMLGYIQQIYKSQVAMRKDFDRISESLKYYEGGKPDELTLKGIWVDFIDTKRGASSMAAMEKNLQFLTIRDWFFKVDAKDSAQIDKDVDALNTNERIKVILKRKLAEYSSWKTNWKESLDMMKKILEERMSAQKLTIEKYKDWVRPEIKSVDMLTQDVDKIDPSIFEIANVVKSEVILIGWSGKSGADIQKKILEFLKNKEVIESENIKDFSKINSEKITPEIWKEMSKKAIDEEWVSDKPFGDFNYWIPVMEANFSMIGASPSPALNNTFNLRVRVYRMDKFLKEFLKWYSDPTEVYLNSLLNGIKEEQAKLKEKKSDYPGIIEGFTALGKAFSDIFKKFDVGLSKRGNQEEKYKLKAEQFIDEKGDDMYVKFKKKFRMLTWADFSIKEEERLWKWWTEGIR